MAGDDADDTQARTGGDTTRYKALVARISYLSQDRPDLKFASMQVCCAMASPSVPDMERLKRIGRYLAEKPRAVCLCRWQKWVNWKRIQTPIGVVTEPRDDQCQLE